MDEKTVFPSGNTLEIVPDECPEDPREWDNLGTLLCFHRRYRLGDKHKYREQDFKGWDEMEEQIRKDLDPVVLLPLGLVDHSGLFLFVGDGAHPCDPGGWDSGRIGFALVTREAAKREYGRLTRKRLEQAEKVLRSEIETYRKYLAGEVYGFKVLDPDGCLLDSCYGFDDPEYAFEEGRKTAEALCPKLAEIKERAAMIQ